jgi:Na+-driven multidrug efflux pump
MRRRYEAFVTDEDNEQNNRKQIKFEAQAISIEDVITCIVSIILRFWKLKFDKYPRWGFEVWKDRSLMGDPIKIRNSWNSSSQSLLWGIVMRFGTHDLVSYI